MLTRIYCVETRDNEETKILWTNDWLANQMLVKDFQKGILTVGTEGICIQYFARMLVGCFHPNSNFAEVIAHIFPEQKEKIKGVKIEFEAIKVLVTPGDTADEICEKWRVEFLRNKEELEADLRNPMDILDSIEFLRKPEISKQEYEKAVKELADPEFVEQACNWAKLMQLLLGKYKKSIVDAVEMADKALKQDGWNRGKMIDFLSKFWKYGEQLSNWYGTDVLAALLTISIFESLF